MTARPSDRAASAPRQATDVPKATTIPAHTVGITLTISDKARKERDKIRERAIKAAKKARNFSWR